MYKHTFYYFLGNKKYPEIYILLKHTNSHFFDTGLKMLTPAPLVVLVTNFKYAAVMSYQVDPQRLFQDPAGDIYILL